MSVYADVPVPRCPKCGEPIVYNGNYFCSSYRDRWCGWAHDSDDREEERDLADALKRGDIKRADY